MEICLCLPTTAEGTRLANGIYKSQLWKNFIKATDQDGKAIVSDAITVALNGGGWTTYKIVMLNEGFT